ncbi:MAG: iron ABC transporter permease [Oscillospiraceae bacterium]|nr:iron ABC transporter permease [Oscillospiraceae bacterium]MBR7075036.1 iron ABC transporter permease [Oscillospiraceae bacterium]
MLKKKNVTIPFYMDPWFWVKIIVFVIFLLFLVWPFSSIIINAFKSTKVEGFTMANFQKFFQKKYYYGALKNSVSVSVVPSLFAIILGVPMAYLMTRYNVWGKKVWHVLAILSLMSPPFLGAYAWIMMFGRAGSVTTFLKQYGISIPTIYGFGGISTVLTLKLYPYIYMYTSGAMESIDSSLEECAENLGSGKLRRFFTVTMPVVTPSITAGALVVFMSALADFGTPMLLGGQDFRTLPVLIYNEYLSEIGGNGNLASAISIIIVIITLVMLVVQKAYVGRRNYIMSALRPPKVVEVHGFRRFLVTLPVFLITFISFLPQIVVCASSFQHTNYSSFTGGFTFENYQNLGSRLWSTMRNTFTYSLTAMVFIVVIGILMSYVIVRKKGKTGGILDMLLMAPYVIPGSVLGLCYIVTFNVKPLVLTGTAAIIIISYIIRKLPYTVRSASAFLMQMDPSVEEASINLGVPPMRTFWKVTARLMLPGVFSGAILSWVTCINELSCSIMLSSGKNNTLTIEAYTNIVRNSVGSGAALSAILTITSAVILIICLKISKGKIRV